MNNICFWLNSLSPHQMPYIQEIAKHQHRFCVFVIVPVVDSEQRMEMGWNTKKYLKKTGIQVLIQPDKQKKEELFSIENSYHFFSGISAFPEVSDSLNLSLNYNVRRGIITEGPTTYKRPLWMHYIRFYIQDYRYVKNIDFVFAIGDVAVNYYQSISKKWKVIPFGYCTEWIERQNFVNEENKIRIIYVGSLSPWKSVITLINALILSPTLNYELTIVGDGSEKKRIERTSLANQMNVNFLGYKSTSEIPHLLQQNDVLVLPSVYDGWGAVINEALTLGLYVIVSDAAGASSLVKDNRLGLVFRRKDVKSLISKLTYLQENINCVRRDTLHRISWSNRHISPTRIAEYFIDQINFG